MEKSSKAKRIRELVPNYNKQIIGESKYETFTKTIMEKINASTSEHKQHTRMS